MSRLARAISESGIYHIVFRGVKRTQGDGSIVLTVLTIYDIFQLR